MSDRVSSERVSGAAEPILRGVTTILVCGVFLGVAFNQLGRMSRPPRGLAWIAEEKVLPKLEDRLGGGAPTGSGSHAAAPAGADPDDPLGGGAGLGAVGESGLPEIPDLDRPFSVELDIVRKFVDAKGALILDAREPDEFAAGHIPGAINVPYESAGSDPARLQALDPGGKPIIIYCGGGTCEVSMHLAETLIFQHGRRRVLVYMGGWPDWVKAGAPVEKGAGKGAGR